MLSLAVRLFSGRVFYIAVAAVIASLVGYGAYKRHSYNTLLKSFGAVEAELASQKAVQSHLEERLVTLQDKHRQAVHALEKASNQRVETAKVVERIKTEIKYVKPEEDRAVSDVLRNVFISLQQHQRTGIYRTDD